MNEKLMYKNVMKKKSKYSLSSKIASQDNYCFH